MKDINLEAFKFMEERLHKKVTYTPSFKLSVLLDSKNKVFISFGTSPLNVLVSIICVILKKKFFVGIHDVISHEPQKRFSIWLYNFILSKTSSNIITFSDFSQEQFKKHFKKETLQFRFKTHLTFKSTEKEYDFVMFGRFLSYQGVEYLERMLDHFSDKKFLFIGKNIPHFIFKYNNASCCKEYVSNEYLYELLSKSRTTIFPYVSATQSGGVPIAYANGSNVVAFDVGALSEQVKKYGYLCEANNLNSFFTQMKKSLEREFDEDSYMSWKNEQISINSIFIDVFRK